MKINAGNVWWICLCAACAASCSAEYTKWEGACGTADLGSMDCQCTAPDDAFSHGSMHADGTARRQLADCKATSAMAFAIKGLQDNEIYACVDHRCVKAECPESLISSEDQESCVNPPTCGKGEVAKKNACECDAENHWKGTPGHCACDTAKNFEESNAGTCVCRKVGGIEYIEKDGACVPKKTCNEELGGLDPLTNECLCDPEKAYRNVEGNCVKKPQSSHPEAQIWDSTTNSWVCDSTAYWKADPENPGRCRCADGYVNMKNGQIDATLTGKCEPVAKCGAKEKLLASQNTCVCDADRNWKGNAPNCFCDIANGYELKDDGNTCAPSCDANKEIYQQNTNSCACDVDHNWFGDSPDCYCDIDSGNYVLQDNGKTCALASKCDPYKETYQEATNSCTCNTAGNWKGTSPDCRCDTESGSFVLVNGGKTCAPKASCDAVKETYQSTTNTCTCNAAGNWKGTSPECYCDTDSGNFVLLDNGRTCAPKASCDAYKETYQATTNTCACNASGNWKGTSPNCYCDTSSGYVLSSDGKTCSPKATCDAVKETYLSTTNTCACNTAGNWQGTPPNCTCGGGSSAYVTITRNGNTVCEPKASCDAYKETYQTTTNTCACNTAGNWKGTWPDCYCDTSSGYVLSSDGKTCSPKAECVSGNTSCNSSTGKYSICQSNGMWGSESNTCTASTTCTTGKCGQCTSGTMCSTSGVQTCLSNGMWSAPEACSASTTCTTGSCGQCTSGNTWCGNGKVKTCLSNGTWSDLGACKATTTCTTGSCSSTCDGILFNSQCVNKGDTVTFGKYPQATSTAEAIEWLVLDIDTSKGQMLLLSKYVLDAKPYNTSSTSITWEKCTLRTWLNGTFKTTAFTPSEQQLIALTPLENLNNPYYNTNGGNATNDYVFLLSLADALSQTNDVAGSGKYFSSNAERKAMATKYAIDNGAYVSKPSGISTCTNVQCSALWWLRSPGRNANLAAYVYLGGDVRSSGDYVSDTFIGVRPALWVKY